MPKKAEMFSPDRKHDAIPANDNVESVAANDNVEHPAAFNEPTLRQAVFALKDADKGAVIFAGGLTLNPSNPTDILKRRDGRSDYGAKLKKLEKKTPEGEVVVITREEIAAQGGAVKEATVHLIADKKKDNADAIILVESPALIEELQKPWKKFPEVFNQIIAKRGSEGKEWLAKWLKDGGIKKEEGGEAGEPTVHAMLEAFKEVEVEMTHFIQHELHGAPFSMELAADPMSVAFAMYLKGELNPGRFEVIADTFDWNDAVVALQFKPNGDRRATIGGKSIT